MDLIQTRDAARLLEIQMKAECGLQDPHSPHVHLMLLLISKDLNEARYLVRRTHPQQKDELFHHLVQILNGLWTQNFALVQTHLPVLSSPDPAIIAMVSWLQESLLSQTLDLIGLAYTSLGVDQCSQMLGKQGPELLTLFQNAGWTVVDGYVHPIRYTVVSESGKVTTDSIVKLTDYVLHLNT